MLGNGSTLSLVLDFLKKWHFNVLREANFSMPANTEIKLGQMPFGD